MAIVVVIVCGLLFVFMRVVGANFGRSIGTLAGIGVLGLIGFGVCAADVMLLLPVILPVALFGVACFVGAKIFLAARRA